MSEQRKEKDRNFLESLFSQLSRSFSSSLSTAFCCLLRFVFEIINDAFMHLMKHALFMEWNFIYPSFSLVYSSLGHGVVGARLSQMGRLMCHTTRFYRFNHLTLTDHQQKLQRHRSRED